MVDEGDVGRLPVPEPSGGMGELALLLHALKERCGHSYAELARCCGLSASSLHRYCRGQVLPDSYGLVERIGKACGASREELGELYRLWSRADTRRAENSAMATGGQETTATATEQPAPVGVRTSDLVSVGSVPASSSARPARSPVRRRRGGLGPGARWAAATLSLGMLLTGGVLWRAADRSSTRQWIPGPSWSRTPTSVPSTLFGVTMNSSTGTMPGFRVGALRLWDSETRWAQLEPRRGSFSWHTLDRLVEGAGRARLPVLFTFGGTPAWTSPTGPKAPYGDGSRASPPDDLADWDAYVKAVATRYRHRIDAYELWNLAPSPRFFTGSAERLAEMTGRASRIIRRADPRATVVCPGIGELWQQESRSSCGGSPPPAVTNTVMWPP
jgi:transcriptional regulator with XRE-family HTH domain